MTSMWIRDGRRFGRAIGGIDECSGAGCKTDPGKRKSAHTEGGTAREATWIFHVVTFIR